MLALGLFRGNGSGRTFAWRVRLLIVELVIFQFSVSLGQPGPVAFSYGEFIEGLSQPQVPEIQFGNITCPSSLSVSNRCLYRNPVMLIHEEKCPCLPSFFSTMAHFFWTGQDTGPPPQGLAFIIVNSTSPQGERVGWLNYSNIPAHNLGVKFKFVKVQPAGVPFWNVNIGVDTNSLLSENTTFEVYIYDITVWIEYNTTSLTLDVYISRIDWKPPSPMLSTSVDLRETLSKGMFVGFEGLIADMNTSADGAVDTFRIDGWTFNSNGRAADVPRDTEGVMVDTAAATREHEKKRITELLASAFPSVGTVLFLLFIIFKLFRRNSRLTALAKLYDIDTNMLNDQGPKSFKYKELSAATKDFSSSQLLGTGGFGSVYKGELKQKRDAKPMEIAVKRISATSNQGASEFLAEVKVIGQAQHRNLVRLVGWCHDRGELLLVYDYMPNGSVDHHLYKSTAGETLLTWSRRMKIASGVVRALVFLHDEWEQRVIHRDVKCSNIMLDIDFNARLGDFGLARTSEHDKELLCTAVAGTRGYLAPELTMTFQPTEKTDVYSFGSVMLELATGKKPMLSREDKESLEEIFLVDWVWKLYRDNRLLDTADCNLQNAYDPGEMILFLKIGLLCCHPNAGDRPSMRDVMNIWKGLSPFPPLPHSKPVPVFGPSSECDDTATVYFTDSLGCAEESEIDWGKGGPKNNMMRHRSPNALPF